MKTPSNSVLTINTLFNIMWGLLLAFSIILIPVSFFKTSPLLPIKVSVNETGIFTASDGKAYHLKFSTLDGQALFIDDTPNGPLNERLFLIFLWSVLLIIFFQFKKLINQVAEGISFQEKSYKRLRYIGGLLLLTPILDIVYFFWIESRYAELITHNAFSIRTNFSFINDFDWYALIGGLTFLVLAEVFKEGFSLKQETELTI